MLPHNTSIESFQAHLLARDPHSKERRIRNTWRDSIGILVSMSKLVEVAIMWQHSAITLSLTSGFCWLYYFLASITIQACGLSREYSGNIDICDVDILAGELPTPMKSGSSYKILLGVPDAVRNNIIWKVSWALGSLISIATVIATYMTLGHQPSRVFAIWTGFQFFWLGIRSVFYHFAQGTDSILHYPISLGKNWNAIPMHFKDRIRRLALALSAYQIHVHPRGVYSYEEDLQPLHRVQNLQRCFVPTSEEREHGAVELSVTGIIGDTVLSSVCWILGSNFTGLQLYDACIIILDVKGTSTAIPCARVLSDKPPPGPDMEIGMETKFPPRGVEPRYPPKGGPNRGTAITWWYWIPCGENLWLQTHTTDMKFLGKRTADLLSDEQVTKKLTSGDLFIGMSEVAHVKEVVQNANAACDILQEFLS